MEKIFWLPIHTPYLLGELINFFIDALNIRAFGCEGYAESYLNAESKGFKA